MIDLPMVLRDELWSQWRFEAWSRGGLHGLFRRASFIKAGLLGEVARYYADDYIVLAGSGDAMAQLMAEARPERDLMVQRYVLIDPQGSFEWRKKAFWMGFKGFAEFYRYRPGGKGCRTIKDLTPLIDRAWKNSAGLS